MLRSPFMAFDIYGFIMINMAGNRNLVTNFGENLGCRVPTICVKRFKGYINSHFKALSNPGYICPILLKIGTL
jgi:hypothetical protein